MNRRFPYRLPARRLSRPARRTAGFTIIEVLAIVTIIGVVLVIGIPRTMKEFGRIRCENFASQTASMIQQTRMRAIRDNQEYSIDIDLAENEFTGLEGGATTGTADTLQLDLDEVKLQLYDDPSCYALTSDDRQYVKGALVYNGQGVADEVRAFCFQDGRGNIMQIAIDTLGGPPKTRKYVDGLAKFSPNKWQWEWL